MTDGQLADDSQRSASLLRPAWVLPAGKEHDQAWLHVRVLVEEGSERAGDGCGLGAVLGEGLG